MEETAQIFEKLPIINFSLLHHDSIIKQIHEACRNFGFFHVINHGIPESVIEKALNVNSMFLTCQWRWRRSFCPMMYRSQRDLVKYKLAAMKMGCFRGTSLSSMHILFIIFSIYGLHHFLNVLLFSKEKCHREKMGMYATEVRKLSIELFGAIMESLNLSPTHLKQNFEHGAQLIGINSYPPCSGSDVKAGTPAHTDHSIITILLQSSPGLHIVDRSDGGWKSVGKIKGSLEVSVGDHLEVISNGLYESVLHRALPSSNNGSRLSIANLLSLEMDDMVEPATKLVNEEHTKRYNGSSLRDFLEPLSSKDTTPFIQTIKI